MKKALRIATGLLAALTAIHVWAQPWPAKPVKLIVTYPPGAAGSIGMEKGSIFDKPSTRWPDFRGDMPPRGSVLAITRADGGEIGG